MKKSIFAILICLSTIYAEDNNERNLQRNLRQTIETALQNEEHILKNSDIYIEPQLVQEFSKALDEAVDQSGITAVINEYADKVLANIAKLIVDVQLDPMALPDLPINLIGGGMNLTGGSLTETSTIFRSGDVIASYSLVDRKLKLNIPIGFKDLAIHYNYKVWVLILSIHGGLEGKLNNVKVNLQLDFDFNTYHATMNKFDITNSGQLILHFTGHGLVDWLINLMSDATSLVLHPLIIRIIQLIITIPVTSIVAKVNEIIDNFLHPTTPIGSIF